MNAAGRGRKRVKLGAARGSGKHRSGGWEGVVEKTGWRKNVLEFETPF